MGGGLMQLVAYGAQDIYLTGNPQITFFKVVYRRHTNFSMEEIEQTPDGSVGFGNTASYTISRNGDLVHKMHFEFTPKNILSLSTDSSLHKGIIAPHFGHTLLKEVECEIGGQLIDRHYNHWLSTRSMLTEPNPTGKNTAITEVGAAPGAGTDTLYNRMSYNHKSIEQTDDNGLGSAPSKAFVPLQFWFNLNPGLALPLIALQYHEVKIKITFPTIAEVTDKTAGSGLTAAEGANTLSSSGKLWAQYIYLDTDERRRFAQVSHEYLIEQLQFQNTTASTSMELNFNHPVKELIWGKVPNTTTITANTGPGVLQKEGAAGAELNYYLKLNGHDRFAPRHHFYFSRQQIYDHHTGFGGTVAYDSILVYSFALKPEEHQPSGTCNFSRIDTAELVASTAPGDDQYIYAINYNVLRIMSGMGGLAYSN